MSRWLRPLEEAPDEAEAPVAFFFRNDDVGWEAERLWQLLAVFAEAETPVDLAIIPAALDRRLARELARRHGQAPQHVRLHQHGFSHANHELLGRKSEFGPARAAAQQLADIARGRRRLASQLEAELDPIFTPPWNRCTAATADALVAAGLSVLSSESHAPRAHLAGLAEIPVCADWFAHRHGTRLTRGELGAKLGAHARTGGPVGVLLHHALMDAAERAGLHSLLALLARADNARVATIAELAPAGAVR